MKRKIVIGMVAVMLTGAGGVAFLKDHRDESSPSAAVAQSAPEATVAVDVAVPARETLRRVVEVFGSLSPKTATLVKNELPAQVKTIRVKEWDDVASGHVLLELDPTDFHLNVKNHEAGLKMTQAQLLQARVDLNRARREWNRAQKLKEGGLITGQELDERRTGSESSEAKVALAQAQVAQAEAQLAEARRNLEKATIRSPIKGTVSERKVDVGDWVDKGAFLFTIVDNRVLDFTANVPATDLTRVAEGQTLFFSVDGLPGRTFQGRIKRVNPTVNATDRSGRIVAEVENTEGLLKGGLYARGHVLVEERPQVLVLPKAALSGWDLERETARIFVVGEDNIARLRDVRTGLVGDDLVEIREGISEGDRVVLRGGFNLREGDRVSTGGKEAEG